jgi:hypothetical protein
MPVALHRHWEPRQITVNLHATAAIRHGGQPCLRKATGIPRLAAEEFLLRGFLQHVLPKKFVKIRHYELLANAQRQARLDACRRLPLVAARATGTLPARPTTKSGSIVKNRQEPACDDLALPVQCSPKEPWLLQFP